MIRLKFISGPSDWKLQQVRNQQLLFAVFHWDCGGWNSFKEDTQVSWWPVRGRPASKTTFKSIHGSTFSHKTYVFTSITGLTCTEKLIFNDSVGLLPKLNYYCLHQDTTNNKGFQQNSKHSCDRPSARFKYICMKTVDTLLQWNTAAESTERCPEVFLVIGTVTYLYVLQHRNVSSH